ncbi:cytoplasmic dynein 2 intermediate chain 1 [Diretmus argenteus]
MKLNRSLMEPGGAWWCGTGCQIQFVAAVVGVSGTTEGGAIPGGDALDGSISESMLSLLSLRRKKGRCLAVLVMMPVWMLPRDEMKTGPLQTLLLKFLPTDSNHFFIGTNMGLVTHGTSHGLKAPPKLYRSQDAGVRPVDVNSIHFSPSRQHLFLVGCGDGSIRLHAVTREQPVVEWDSSTAGEPVVSVQWNQTRPTVFCVLDAASNLHIWDLLRKDSEPVVTERMDADRVTAMAVFGDSGQHNTYSGIALAHGSGKVELQYFTRSFTVATSAEEEKMESMMNESFI